MIEPENTPLTIVKASGDTEPFDVSKLKNSLNRAGAPADIIDEIASNIQDWMFEGMSTRKIYTHAYRLLHKKNRVSALRYKLKKALLEMGPSGYPFEHFIGELFKKEGYQAEVGQVIDGFCITHEMDVIATNKQKQMLLECKYHKDQGKHVSIQVPLYVRSRVDDIIRRREKMKEYAGFVFFGGVVTNTRFSPDSISYAKCSGLDLLGWDYPLNNGLKDRIERAKIFPVTILNNLTRNEKQLLLNKGVVTCTQLLNDLEVVDSFALTTNKMKKLKKELKDICNSQVN